MPRPTVEFTTPAGKIVVFNAYLTGREHQQLKAVIFDNMQIDATSNTIPQISASALSAYERKALEFLFVSYDGKDMNALLDEPESEYKAVIEQVNKIQNPTQPVK